MAQIMDSGNEAVMQMVEEALAGTWVGNVGLGFNFEVGRGEDLPMDLRTCAEIVSLMSQEELRRSVAQVEMLRRSPRKLPEDEPKVRRISAGGPY